MPTLTVYSPTLTAVATIPDVYGPTDEVVAGRVCRMRVSGKHTPGTYASFGGQDTRSWWHISGWTYTPSNADGRNGAWLTPPGQDPHEGTTACTLTRLGDEASALAAAIANDRNTNQPTTHTISIDTCLEELGFKPDTIKRMNKAITNQH